MQNELLAAAITLCIYGFIGLFVTALIFKPFISLFIVVFIGLFSMVFVFKLIYKILKNDKDDCTDF